MPVLWAIAGIAALVGLAFGASGCKSEDSSKSPAPGVDPNVCQQDGSNAYVIRRREGIGICDVKGGSRGMIPLFRPVPLSRDAGSPKLEAKEELLNCPMMTPASGTTSAAITVRVQKTFGDADCADKNMILQQLNLLPDFMSIQDQKRKQDIVDVAACMALDEVGNGVGIREVRLNWDKIAAAVHCLIREGGRVPAQGEAPAPPPGGNGAPPAPSTTGDAGSAPKPAQPAGSGSARPASQHPAKGPAPSKGGYSGRF